jgi:uncharacterized protein (DUF1501 family)
VRFVQLYHTNWDSHGGPGENLQGDFEKVCREVDRGQAALVKDLKARGLLDETLVIWGGEFGRTPMGENRETTGRNHHIDAFTMWFAGGGVKGGQTLGETDELGVRAVGELSHARFPCHDSASARPGPEPGVVPEQRPPGKLTDFGGIPIERVWTG